MRVSRVEAYRIRTGSGGYKEVAGDEACALVLDPKLGKGASGLLGWLAAVQGGEALPGNEPFAPQADGHVLRYRCDGGAIVMFDYMKEDDLVLVLGFAPAATALPTVAVCREAARRRQNWRITP